MESVVISRSAELGEENKKIREAAICLVGRKIQESRRKIQESRRKIQENREASDRSRLDNGDDTMLNLRIQRENITREKKRIVERERKSIK